MNIKICKKNANLIEKELKKVNGKASAHVIFDPIKVIETAEKCENRLLALLVLKKHCPKCVVKVVGGSRLPSAYKYNIISTSYTMERRRREWYLTSCSRCWGGRKGQEESFYLTEEQDVIAKQILSMKYSVIRNVEKVNQ